MKKTAFVLLALVLVGGIVAAGCISGNTTAGKPDGSWVLDSNKNITLIIDGTSISGNSGVNQYFGKITADNGKIELGPIGSTMMVGPVEDMKAESEYLASLENITGYKFDDGKLVLTDKDGKAVLTFEKATEKTIQNSQWVTDDGIIIRFSEEGKLSGNAPINLYIGEYTLAENNKISLSPAAATKMAGSVEDTKKETEYFETLNKVAGYKIVGDKLTLNDKDDNVLLTFSYAEVTAF